MKPVWIVDDDRAIRWVLEKALARAGVPTRSFSQAADVLEALSHETPVALVSDIRMPGGNGSNCCASSRNAIRACRSSS